MASGARSSSATDTMNPAESATMLSRARTLQRERETTAAAPMMLALAAIAVYRRAVPFIQRSTAFWLFRFVREQRVGSMVKSVKDRYGHCEDSGGRTMIRGHGPGE